MMTRQACDSPETMENDTRWLERHGRRWRVTVAVLRDLHGTLGTRLKRDLGTDSRAIANGMKPKVLADLREKIEQARRGSDARCCAAAQETDRPIELTEEDVDSRGRPDLDHQIIDRVKEILRSESGDRTLDSRAYIISIHELKLEPSHKTCLALARDHATPMMSCHGAYLEKSLVKARAKADDVRAMRYLARWCERAGVPPTLQAIDRRSAIRFMDQFGGLAPRTQNKYLIPAVRSPDRWQARTRAAARAAQPGGSASALTTAGISRISRYWEFMLRREHAEKNPWCGVVVAVPTTKYDEEERAFKDAEVRAFLVGGAEPRLTDLMLIAALTGARLDAIVDLKVKDVADGAFTFKPQKRERTARDVPIHPTLVSIVTRRTIGRSAEEPFFPEWPAPIKEGSLRERSFKASNRFTEYRRACGGDAIVVGKRRSLVNFHSFRRWFITKAERAGNSGDLAAAMVGHKRSGMTLGRYSEGPDWEAARRCIESVKLPTLDDAPLTEVGPPLTTPSWSERQMKTAARDRAILVSVVPARV